MEKNLLQISISHISYIVTDANTYFCTKFEVDPTLRSCVMKEQTRKNQNFSNFKKRISVARKKISQNIDILHSLCQNWCQHLPLYEIWSRSDLPFLRDAVTNTHTNTYAHTHIHTHSDWHIYILAITLGFAEVVYIVIAIYKKSQAPFPKKKFCRQKF